MRGARVRRTLVKTVKKIRLPTGMPARLCTFSTILGWPFHFRCTSRVVVASSSDSLCRIPTIRGVIVPSECGGEAVP